MPREGWKHKTGQGGCLSTGGGFARKDAVLRAPLLFIVFHFFFPSPKGAVGPVLAPACALTNAGAAC